MTDDLPERLATERADLEKSQANMRLSLEAAGQLLRMAMKDLDAAINSGDAEAKTAARARVARAEASLQEVVTQDDALRARLHAVTMEELTHASLGTARAVARATWILSGATIVLAVATVALIWATLAS